MSNRVPERTRFNRFLSWLGRLGKRKRQLPLVLEQQLKATRGGGPQRKSSLFRQHEVLQRVAETLPPVEVSAVNNPQVFISAKDSYEVLELVGEGNYGKVYKVRAKSTGRILALKAIRLGTLISESDLRALLRFEQEIRLLETMGNYEHFVEFVDAKQDNGTRFYVMEYVPKTLRDLLNYKRRRGRTVSLKDARDFLRQMCLALEYAYSKNDRIVHRDLKPENIGLVVEEQDGEQEDKLVLKMLDFGLAKPLARDMRLTLRFDQSSDVPFLIGTEAYLPSEARDFGVNLHPNPVKIDVHAVGVIFFEMLTGLHPNQVNDFFGEGKPIRPEGVTEFDFELLCLLLHSDHNQRPDYATILSILDLVNYPNP